MRKIDEETAQFCKENLVKFFDEKNCLADISSAMTDLLDNKMGGFWLCNIRPMEVEYGLIKSEYKHLDMTFNRDGNEYQIYVSQTKKPDNFATTDRTIHIAE